jgi:hypothetical protein
MATVFENTCRLETKNGRSACRSARPEACENSRHAAASGRATAVAGAFDLPRIHGEFCRSSGRYPRATAAIPGQLPLDDRERADPVRLEPATSWFVFVNAEINHDRLTTPKIRHHSDLQSIQ